MDDAKLLERMQEMQRIIASTQAELADTMARFAGARDGILDGEFATDEIAVALRCGRGRVLSQVRLAEGVQAALPATWAAWRAGEIDAYKAAQILDAAERLTMPTTWVSSTLTLRAEQSRRRLHS